MNEEQILIAGAGPAGAATSLFLSKLKIHHTIIDKATFPRDKICGDALSGKVVHMLKMIDPNMITELSQNKIENTGSYGICFYAPNGKRLDVPFSMNQSMLKNAPGFISRRINFDNYLFNKIDRTYATVKENTELTNLKKEEGGIVVTLKNGNGSSINKFKLIIGAEGERSIVAKKLCPVKKDLSTYCAALRAYYTGVKGTNENNFIELHFIKDLLPGYFWIFPMNDGSANVGIGMLSEVVSKKKINLRNKLFEIINEHPVIKKRFEGAKLQGDVQGWGLPLGSSRRTLTGDHFILTGDAASLIDPFTGEGIGNAILSGKYAADIASRAIQINKFNNEFLSSYETDLYKNVQDELRLSHGIQKLAKNAWLFNFVVQKATNNKMLRETITCMFDDLDIRSRLKKPSFYFKLLFN
jgi:geranylgeranyl reductase family protein